MRHPEKIARQQEEAQEEAEHLQEEAEHLQEDDCQWYMWDMAHAMAGSGICIIDPLSDLQQPSQQLP